MCGSDLGTLHQRSDHLARNARQKLIENLVQLDRTDMWEEDMQLLIDAAVSLATTGSSTTSFCKLDLQPLFPNNALRLVLTFVIDRNLISTDMSRRGEGKGSAFLPIGMVMKLAQ